MRISPRASATAAALAIVSIAPFSQGQQAPASAPVQAIVPVDTAPKAATQPATEPSPADSQPTNLQKVVVSDLDLARSMIAPSLGATTYTVGPSQIAVTPGGENASFQQVLTRMPGVVQDSFGQEHVRGEHANLTYRVNGVLLPEPLNGFGQELDTRLIQSATLITGSLPAQFGFHTAGVVDVLTKSGDSLNGSEVSIYGGSFDTITPSFASGGRVKNLDYFFTGTYTHDDLGLENPTASHHALHDYTDQERLFGYLSYHIDDTSRISLLLNGANSVFQIPTSPNVPPAFTLDGATSTPDSRNIDEVQREQEYYSVLSYQKSTDNLSLQLSGFSRYGEIDFSPDPINDLIFQGVAGDVRNSFVTNGVQFDSSLIVNDQHTLRAGLIADYTIERLDTNTAVFTTDSNGDQLSTMPENITDASGNTAWEAGVYLQDEWRFDPHWTLNYGLRYDRFDASFDHEGQLSPRINLVWKPTDETTLHAGYSRYFVPPPVQNLNLDQVEKFANTTNAPEIFLADPPKVERSNYYDAGISQQITKLWQVSVDGFYKQSHQLIDLGQFGAPVILSPFNYRAGTVYGAELSSTYTTGGLSLFGNFSWARTAATDISSQQYLFDSDEFAYIQDHNVHLDHESDYTVSAGASYAWTNDRVYLDFLYGSGLRSGFANTQKIPSHYPVNVGYEHIFHLDGATRNTLNVRVDLVNVFDEKYEIRDGSGIGVGAAQFGERRGVFLGLTYHF